MRLEEISVSYTFHQAKGLYVRRLRREGRAHTQVPKRDLRGAVTHVAIMRDRSEIQPRLPQVLQGNKHRFTQTLVAGALGSKPSNVHLFRRKSSWNNTTCTIDILDLLAEALRDFPTLQPILLLDTASCHINDPVAAKAGSFNIWLAPVPAGLTHLLQPLDVYGSAGYKGFLKSVHRTERAAHGKVTPQSWLKLLFDVCTRFLNSRKWSVAFPQVGLGALHTHFSAELQAIIPQGRPQQPPSYLSGAELARMMPSNRKVWFLHWVCAPANRRRSLTVR